jgi:hypothetical protein
MRNTSGGEKSWLTTLFSSRAERRSCPNGFSITTRFQVFSPSPVMALRLSWEITCSKYDGGMDR